MKPATSTLAGEREPQKAAVTQPSGFEPAFEPALQSRRAGCEGRGGAFRHALRALPVRLLVAQQVGSHGGDERATRTDDQREHHGLGERHEQIVRDAAELNIGTNTIQRQVNMTNAGAATICREPSMIAASMSLPCSRW